MVSRVAEIHPPPSIAPSAGPAAVRRIETFLQFRLTLYKAQRYRSMQALVTEYKDYLDVCVKQGYDMSNSFILYPKDLQKAHDKVAHRIQMKADAQLRRDFQVAY